MFRGIKGTVHIFRKMGPVEHRKEVLRTLVFACLFVSLQRDLYSSINMRKDKPIESTSGGKRTALEICVTNQVHCHHHEHHISIYKALISFV